MQPGVCACCYSYLNFRVSVCVSFSLILKRLTVHRSNLLSANRRKQLTNTVECIQERRKGMKEKKTYVFMETKKKMSEREGMSTTDARWMTKMQYTTDDSQSVSSRRLEREGRMEEGRSDGHEALPRSVRPSCYR